MDEKRLAEALERGKLVGRLPSVSTRVLLRRSAGMSQEDVAAVVGVTRPTVTRWEQGKRTPRGEQLRGYVELLERLAEELT
jgi:transcriptional regulator with XRE-family HTH domain